MASHRPSVLTLPVIDLLATLATARNWSEETTHGAIPGDHFTCIALQNARATGAALERLFESLPASQRRPRTS